MKAYHTCLRFVTSLSLVYIILPHTLIPLTPPAHASSGIRIRDTEAGTISANAFGVNVHLAQRIPEADWDAVLGKASDMGVTWAREEFNWDTIEPEDDQYDWKKYDAVVAAYEVQKIEVLGLLTYSSAWASSQPDSSEYRFFVPDAEAWEEYVSTVVSHFPDITAWEIWNEPNHPSFLNATPDEYADVFRVAARAIRRANPTAQIVLGGLSGADTSYLEKIYQAVDDMDLIDVVAVHPYRDANGNMNFTPEESVDGLYSLSVDLASVKAVVNRYDADATPIWLTEMGWKTSSDGVSERAQAQFLLRMYTIALSTPGVESVFWYALVDHATEDADHFGLLNQTYAPKPGAVAMAFAQAQLVDHAFVSSSMISQRRIMDFISTQSWKVEGAACTRGSAGTVNGALKVDMQFSSPQHCYGVVPVDFALHHTARMIQFRAKGSNARAVLRVRVVDSSGETFQYNFGRMTDEWMTYRVNVNEHISHWNGDGDGRLDRPLRLESFVLDNLDHTAEKTTVLIDDIADSRVPHGYIYQFQKQQQPVVAFWTRGRSRVFQLRIPPVQTATLHSLWGEQKTVSADASTFTLRAYPTTRFLRGQ